jgi:uncharacterized protein with HEPN domain
MSRDAHRVLDYLAHGYFKVDLGIVWKTLENELPPLKRTVTHLLLLLPCGDDEAPT